MKLEEVLQYFPQPKKQGNGSYLMKCPAHDDNNPSLSISKGNKQEIIMHCHAGCSYKSILSMVGLSESDLFYTNGVAKKNENRKVVSKRTTYIYTDEFSNQKHFVNREYKDGKKSFVQGHFDDNGKKVFKIPEGFVKYPYNLPILINTIKSGDFIYFVEGEKDADRLISHSLTATTICSGVNGWNDTYKQHFKNAKVIIIPDNDIPGMNFATKVLKSIESVTQFAIIINLPDLDEKEDVSDYIDKYGFDKFQSFVDNQINISRYEGTIVQVKDVDNIKEDIDEIRSNIYEDGKLIDKKVAEEVFKRIPLRLFFNHNNKINYLLYNDGFWQSKPKESVGSLFQHWLKDKDCKERRIKEIINLFHNLPEFIIYQSKINSKIHCHNFNNGTYDFETFKFYPHSPDDYFTYKVPYNYLPEADCPLFKSVLNDYSKTKGIVEPGWEDLVLEMMAVTLNGNIPNDTIFWLLGDGANGKGTIIRILQYLIGINLTLPDFNLKLLNDKFGKAGLSGKKLIVAPDFPTYMHFVHILKSITGGDTQVSDTKFGNSFNFSVYGKLIFAMNQLPEFSVSENPKPIERRVTIIPFNHKIIEKDSDIENRILQEAPGIINLLISKLKQFKQRKNTYTKITNGEKRKKQYFEQLSPVDEFLQNIEFSKDAEGIFSIDLYDRFSNEMKTALGNNWEKKTQIVGTKKLLPHLAIFLKNNYYYDIEKDYIYCKVRRGKQMLIKYLRWK